MVLSIDTIDTIRINGFVQKKTLATFSSFYVTKLKLFSVNIETNKIPTIIDRLIN